MIQRLLASVVVLALAAGQADAGLLSLNFHSQTMGSSLGGAPIPDGLDFDVRAIFLDDFDFQSDPGIGLFLVTQIDVKITGIPIPVIFSLFDYGAYVFDPSLALGYVPALAAVGGGGALAPAYSAATPPISGDAPTTTVFSDYLGSVETAIFFPTIFGDLILDYGTNPVEASITAVPEPSTLSMCAILVGLVGLTSVRRRRKAGRAAA